MPSHRGQYAHGRDKDEEILRWYNEGFQSSEFVRKRAWRAALILWTLLFLVLGGFAAGNLVDSANASRRHREVKQAYEDGYHAGFEAGARTTTTTTVPEPTPLPAPNPNAQVPLTG